MSLRRYATYKESRVNWLGEIPQHWEVKRIKRVTRLVTRKAESRSFPVALENIEGWSGKFIVSAADYEGDGTAFGPGDLLFGKLRPYLAKAWVADRAGEAVGDFLVLRPIHGCHPGFIQMLMLTQEVISQIDGSTFGAKMPRASWEFVGDLQIPLPSPSEQSSIVDFLADETAKIDNLVAEQQRLIALLKEKRQAVIYHKVTKGLTPDVRMRDSEVEWIGKLPSHWGTKRVKYVARLESGHTPDKQVPEYWKDGDIDWVSLNDSKFLSENDYVSDTAFKMTRLGLENSSARILPQGAVVFTRDATIGLAAITTKPMAVSQHLIAWCPSNEISAEYLLRAFNAMRPFLDSYTFGATIKTIGMADVKKLVTPVPPPAEQHRIAASLNVELGNIDALIAEVERAISLLTERRSALISAAVTGKIDVRGLAPAVQEAA